MLEATAGHRGTGSRRGHHLMGLGLFDGAGISFNGDGMGDMG